MVRAIHNGVNVKENCVHYVRGMAEEETKKIAELRNQERTEQEIRQQKITDITDRFITLSDNIAELNTANEESANEATNLAQYIQDISRLCDELNESIRIMSDFISVYKRAMKIFLPLQDRQICFRSMPPLRRRVPVRTEEALQW